MEKITLPALPVLDDFALFLAMLQGRKQLPLSKATAQLNRQDLFRLNEELHFKADWVGEKSPQSSYPALDYFYHVVLAGKLARVQYGPKGNTLQLDQEKLEGYFSLTNTEKYFFLLETSWCYLNWGKLSGNSVDFFLPDLFKLLRLMADSAPGQAYEVVDGKVTVSGNPQSFHLTLLSREIQMFWYLGYISLEPDTSLLKKPDRYAFPFRKVISGELSRPLVPVLLGQRDFEDWNLPYRKEFGLWKAPLGVPQEVYQEEWEEQVPDAEREALPAFLDAFTPLFAPGELEESLYPKDPAFTGGRYTLKVALSSKLYRTFALGASATLLDLHLAIQAGFSFDDDHLYAFYMDGERWSDLSFSDPRSEQPPFADEVKLGELELYPGGRFLYLFDFGASWEFMVTVEAIDPAAPEPEAPVLVEEKGKAPEQYGYGEDDDGW
jgi:hypothetical protein